MAVGHEVSEFLTTRRARITPADVGLVAGSRRRVAGLRREEVAMLAGISVEYYTHLERGNARGASDDVLDAIARALKLDDVERSHLFDLVRLAKQQAPRAKRTTEKVRPGVQRLLDAMNGSAAFVRNGRLDVLSANRLGYALYSEVFVDTRRPANLARFVFLDTRSRTFYADWETLADQAAGNLRVEAGRDPYDRDLTELVGELSMRSDEFRSRWADHDVLRYRTGNQRFHHPLVGDLELGYEVLCPTADTGQVIVAYTPDTEQSADALARLASWASEHQAIQP
jgi:transcriptional regulator with XRE-family HTH domain